MAREVAFTLELAELCESLETTIYANTFVTSYTNQFKVIPKLNTQAVLCPKNPIPVIMTHCSRQALVLVSDHFSYAE